MGAERGVIIKEREGGERGKRDRAMDHCSSLVQGKFI